MSSTGTDRPRFNDVPRAHLREATRNNHLRYITAALREEIGSLLAELDLAPGSRLLDFGCAELPYADLVPNDVEHVGADLIGNPNAQMFVSSDGTLDVTDETFDAVLSTQVLEHVADPTLYLAESFRVLRPGGQLALTTHGMMVYHPDPVDFWRWTCSGLQRVVSEAGFEITRFAGVMGTAATGVQLIQDALLGRVPRRLRPLVIAVSQRVAAELDARQTTESKARDAFVFGLIARRPDPAGDSR